MLPKVSNSAGKLDSCKLAIFQLKLTSCLQWVEHEFLSVALTHSLFVVLVNNVDKLKRHFYSGMSVVPFNLLVCERLTDFENFEGL